MMYINIHITKYKHSTVYSVPPFLHDILILQALYISTPLGGVFGGVVDIASPRSLYLHHRFHYTYFCVVYLYIDIVVVL